MTLMTLSTAWNEFSNNIKYFLDGINSLITLSTIRNELTDKF